MNQEDEALVQAAQTEGVLPEAATLVLNDPAPSWVVTTLSFIGAQFAVWPFLFVLALLGSGVFFELPGSLVMASLLIVGAVSGLRTKLTLFLNQLCVTALLVGLGLLAFSLATALKGSNLMLVILFIVQVGVALMVRVAWVQRLLGFLAALTLMMIHFGAQGNRYEMLFWQFPQVLNAVLLALAWAAWCVNEPRLSIQKLARNVAAFADGVGVALLGSALYASGSMLVSSDAFSHGSRAGSADSALAGMAPLFQITGMVALQLLLVVAAWLWLIKHWNLLDANKRRELVTLSTAYGCLLVFGFFTHDGGVVVLVGTVALATGRKHLLLLALVVLLAQLSGFYYALAWPLVEKAAVLVAVGCFLSVLLAAIHRHFRHSHAPIASADTRAKGRVAQTPLAILWVISGLVLALGIANYDVFKKEQVIKDGQKIYVALAPRDPRSLMQGDYMALNFGFPRDIETTLDEQAPGRNQTRAMVVARLDARGVASVLRVAAGQDVLAPGELILPLKQMHSRWVLVTDAFYFPEGQGESLSQARFGEFRVLPDGRALLVGLADEQLQPLHPAKR